MIFWTYNVFCNLNVGEMSLVYIYINFVNIRVCLISSLHTNRQSHKRLPCSPRQHTELFSFSWIIHVLFWLGPFHLFEEHYTYSNSVYAFIYKQMHVLTKWISFFITLDKESFALFCWNEDDKFTYKHKQMWHLAAWVFDHALSAIHRLG